MDERRQRIHDDLRGQIRGELYLDEVRRRLYGVDAGWFEVDPLGVVVPLDRDDVVTLVRYALENRLVLHPRGGGTSTSGQSLGTGIVVDMSRHFRQVLEVGDDNVVAQAGVVLSQLEEQLGPRGRRFAVDVDRPGVRTLGGLIAIDAVGPRSLLYGSMAQQVEKLEVVLASGEVAEFSTDRPDLDRGRATVEESGLRETIVRRMTAIAGWHGATLSQTVAPGRRLTYAMEGLTDGENLGLARIFAGSHGTLGLITQATLRTVPIPASRRVLLACFGRLTDAAAASPECLVSTPSRCELFDWRSIRLAREASSTWRDLVPAASEAALVVEIEGEDPVETAERARGLVRQLNRMGRLTGPVVESLRRSDCEQVLGLRELVDPLLSRGRGRTRPMPLFRELFVPPDRLAAAVLEFQSLFQKFEVDWVFQGALGPGLLRLDVLVDRADASERAKLSSLAVAVFDAVAALGGGTCGEDARPLIPGPLLRQQLGALGPIAREIKSTFDPHHLLNPGKTGDDRSDLADRPFRREPGGLPAGLTIIEPALRWPDRPATEEVSACNGCGECRTREPSGRMCPAFRALGTEPSSPRSKAHLFRMLVSGELDVSGQLVDELKEVADLCLNCRMCDAECPAGVDISGLVLELKAAYAEDRGLSPTDWVISRLETWGKLATLFPYFFNTVIGQPVARWAIERIFGLSRHRRWPKARRWSYLHRAERLGLTRPRPSDPGPRVAYFVDTFDNYFHQANAEAVVGVLRHCGVNVFVPRKQRVSGMPALQVGDIDRAREHARDNLRVLGAAVREGYTIVCSEPAATLMLKHDYIRLTDDIDAELVASNTMDLGAYLLGLEARGLLPKPKVPLGARVGYHQPCHQRSLGIGTPSIDLLRLVPGLDVVHIDRGCSGMGGIYGLYRDNFLTSLRAGRGLARRLREPDIDLGASECGACRMQMGQGSTKRSYHPIQLLALGYGLEPGLRTRYKDPKAKTEVI